MKKLITLFAIISAFYANAATYQLITSLSELEGGCKYIILSSDQTKLMGCEFSNIKQNPKRGAANSIGTSNYLSSDKSSITVPDDDGTVALLNITAEPNDKWAIQLSNGTYKGNYISQSSGVFIALTSKKTFSITEDTNSEGAFCLKNNKYYLGLSTTGYFYFFEKSRSVYLYKEMPSVTTTGYKEILNGVVGSKYQINGATTSRSHFYDGEYLYVSTTGNSGTNKNTTNIANIGWKYSDNPDNFSQEDWIAVKGSYSELGSVEIEGGWIVKLTSNDKFPVVELVSDWSKTTTVSESHNTFHVANFNIGNCPETETKNLWFVAPQPGEYCSIYGYLATIPASDATTIEIQASETNTITATVALNGVAAPVATGWYILNGIVENTESGMQIRMISISSDLPSGIEDADCGYTEIVGSNGKITVSAVSEVVNIYTTNGALVSSTPVSGNAEIAIAPGLYIVKAGNKVARVLVK